MSKHAIEVAGRANAATNIAAEFYGCQARGNGCRGAAGRAAAGAVDVPWIIGGAIDLIKALQVRAHKWHIGFAEDDGACVDIALHANGVGLRYVVFALGNAADGNNAFGRKGILNGHGHPMQRSPVVAILRGAVSLCGALPGAFEIEGHYRIDLGIVVFNALNEKFQHLGGGQLLRLNLLGQSECALIKYRHAGTLRGSVKLVIPTLGGWVYIVSFTLRRSVRKN